MVRPRKIRDFVLTLEDGKYVELEVPFAAPHMVIPGIGNSHDSVQSCRTASNELDGNVLDLEQIADGGTEQPKKRTRYGQEKVSQIENWNAIRDGMFTSFQESLVPGMNCRACSVPLVSVYRCDDCYVGFFLCGSCVEEVHRNTLFHQPYKWQARTWNPFVPKTCAEQVVQRHDHSCSTAFIRPLVVVDHKGRYHQLNFRFCQCEPESVTLIRHHLWPSSPKKPRMCFHFHFMDLLRVIYLQATIPVMDFCEAFKHLYSPYIHLEDPAIQNIYRVLINESFEEYRAFIYQCEYLRDVCPDFGDGTVCPACPMEDDYPVIISMDGNFGLVRKKSSGVSFSQPKHADHFFTDQSGVDEFVQKHNGNMKKAGNDCSNFKAGNTLRTNSRYEKLDETAVFGSACRHEVPIIMFSLKHGERFAYPVYMVKKLLEKYDGKDLFVMYDVACTLESHLKRSGSGSLLDRLKLAIPIFHCYGHKFPCKVKYSPRRVVGVGLTDGETLERLWSYLRSFSKITKEMTSSHRIDVLADALIYYTHKKVSKIGSYLASKMMKAEDVMSTTKKELKALLDQLKVTEGQVELWLAEAQNPGISHRPRRDLSSKASILHSVNKHCVERRLHLEMVKKYADGQAIAIRLQKNIKRTNRHIKKMVEIFNSKDVDESLPEFLSYEDALKGVYLGVEEAPIAEVNESVPYYLREQAVDLFCHHSRAVEERCLLLKEMVNVDRFFRKQHQVLLVSAASDNLTQGQMAMVVAKAISIEGLHKEFYESCKGIVNLPLPERTFMESIVNDRNYSITTNDLDLPEEEVSDFLERAKCLEEEGEQDDDDDENDYEMEDGADEQSDYFDMIDL